MRATCDPNTTCPYQLKKLEFNDFSCTMFQSFEETQLQVIIRCATQLHQFQRGYVSDIFASYSLYDIAKNEIMEETEHIKIANCVLVYINKIFEIGSCGSFEYIFFK